jgi:fatty aldehyde-generating acyl-ACP reductase
MAEYAFIVHSRDRHDLPRKFPWLSFLPTFVFDLVTLFLKPIVVSEITGLISKDNLPMSGLVIGIPMTARQLLERRSLAVKRIIEAVILAKRRGAKYIGLGAMTASLSRGGKDVIENIENIYVTTGRTFTIKNIIDYVEYLTKKFNLSKKEVLISIVGAGGGIGSGVAIGLARKDYKNFLLIDLERKLPHLKKHIQTLEGHSSNLNIQVSHRVKDIELSSIIIAATSSPEIVIRSEDVNPGSIIINDAQPSDVSPDILKSRRDVLVIEGGVLSAPGMDCHINMGLAKKDDIFSCLAETLLLTYLKVDRHHSINEFDADLYSKLEELSSNLGFQMSMQNDLGLIDEKQLEDFARILAQNKS